MRTLKGTIGGVVTIIPQQRVLEVSYLRAIYSILDSSTEGTKAITVHRPSGDFRYELVEVED